MSLRARLADTPPDAVLRVRVDAALVEAAPALFTAARLRAMVPPTTNVTLAVRRAE